MSGNTSTNGHVGPEKESCQDSDSTILTSLPMNILPDSGRNIKNTERKSIKKISSKDQIITQSADNDFSTEHEPSPPPVDNNKDPHVTDTSLDNPSTNSRIRALQMNQPKNRSSKLKPSLKPLISSNTTFSGSASHRSYDETDRSSPRSDAGFDEKNSICEEEKDGGSRSEIQNIMDQFSEEGHGPGHEEIMSPRFEAAGSIQHPPRNSSLAKGVHDLRISSTSPLNKQLSDLSDVGPAVPPKHSSVSAVAQSNLPEDRYKSMEATISPSLHRPPPPESESEPDLPFDFHRFLEQLRHRTADPVAKFLRSFLQEFGKKQWMVHEQVKIISDFLAFITNKMAQCEVWCEVSDAEFDNAREGMEKLVMNRLYTQTFSPAILPPQPIPGSKPKRKGAERPMGPGRRGQHQEDVERDEILAQKVSIYGWIREEHLDIPPVPNSGKNFLNLAQKELLKIKTYRAPRDKIICVLNCCKVIFGLLKHSKSDSSADSFMPLLIYVVLQANPEHLVSNVQYILRFRNQEKLAGEAGYYLSSLLGAVHFIENLDRTTLTVSDEDFEKNVEAAVSAIAEKHQAQVNEPEKSEIIAQNTESAPSSKDEVANSNQRSMSSTDNEINDASDEKVAIGGLLRTIQRPLSTIGWMFSEEGTTTSQDGSTRISQSGNTQNTTSSSHFNTRNPQNYSCPVNIQDKTSSSKTTDNEHDQIKASAHDEDLRQIQRLEYSNIAETLASMFPDLDREIIRDVVTQKEGSEWSYKERHTNSSGPAAMARKKNKSQNTIEISERSIPVPPSTTSSALKTKKITKISKTASSALIICRNKHWRYISSFHGGWLQLPPEVLETLATNNYNLPRPRPIDPAVFFDILKIRKLVDDATNLSVRATSGVTSLTAANYSSIGNGLMGNGTAALGIGLGGGGVNTKLSRERKHRMREQATQKLSKAYHLDEIACSVATMQSASTLEDVAQLVLQRNSNDIDAKYVHFFHEKIPSRQLAECTTLQPLDEIIAEHPSKGEILRTRAVTRIFKNDFIGAAQDLTSALQICRYYQSQHTTGKKQVQITSEAYRSSRRRDDTRVNEADQPSGLETQLLFHRAGVYLTIACQSVDASLSFKETQNVRKNNITEPVTGPGQPLEEEMTLSEKEAHLKRLEARRIVKTNAKRAIRDYLAYLSHFDYTPGVFCEITNKFKQDTDQESDCLKPNVSQNYSSSSSKKPCSKTNQNSSNDRHSDTSSHSRYSICSRSSCNGSQSGNISDTPSPPVVSMSSLFSATPPTNIPPYPDTSTSVNTTPQLRSDQSDSTETSWGQNEFHECLTYHPLLTDALHSLLLCHCLVQTSTRELQRHAYMVSRLARVCDGYPIFQTARSPSRADWIEVLRRSENWIHLSSSWEVLCAPALLPGQVAYNQQKETPLQRQERLRQQAIIEALEDDRVHDEASFHAAVSARQRRQEEENIKSEGRYGPKKLVQETGKDYPLSTERAHAIMRWIKEAPLGGDVVALKKKKRTTKSSDGIKNKNSVEIQLENLNLSENHLGILQVKEDEAR